MICYKKFEKKNNIIILIFFHFLGNVREYDYFFPVGMYEGAKKPKDIDGYMCELVSELNVLIFEGVNGVQINLGNFIMDAPARAMILDVKQPPGYFCCHKCHIKGTYANHLRTITFTGTGHQRRTHAEFVEKYHFEVDGDKRLNHHLSGYKTAIESIRTIDVVLQNPTEYMHSTCLGLMRKLLENWEKTIPDFILSVDYQVYSHYTF